MSDADDVKLREHIEAIIALRFQTLERVMEERQKTLELTARNLEVHLTHLNGIQEKTEKDRGEFLRVGIYNEMHSAMAGRINVIEEALNSKLKSLMEEQIVPIKTTQARLAGMGVILIILAGVLGSVVTHVFFK